MGLYTTMDKEYSFFSAHKFKILAGLLLLSLLVVYWQVHDHAFLSYDDDIYITQNELVKTGLSTQGINWAFRSFHASNWHPLTWMSHMLDVQLFGLNAGAHHLVNLLLHILNTFLIIFLLKAGTGRVWSSWLVGALFALHPLHAESVAWIAERKDLLSSIWGILAIGSYAGYVKKQSKPLYCAAVIFFIFGLLSKPMLVSLPLLLLILDFWPLQRYLLEKTRTILLEKVPFALLSLISCIITFLAQQHGESVVSIASQPVIARFANAAVSYIAYLGKIFYPVGLAVFYPFPKTISFAISFGALALLILIFGAAVMWRKKYPFFLAGWLWYFIALVPVIGLVQVGEQAMADRYTYLPSLGIFVIISWGIGAAIRKREALKPLFVCACIAALASLIVIARQQVSHWQNHYSLFSHTIKVTENNYSAHFQLGNALVGLDRLGEAREQFSRSIEIFPTAKAYNNLAYVMEKRGKLAAAAIHYKKAILLDHSSTEAHFNLGLIRLKEWSFEEAIQSFSAVLHYQPNNLKAKQNLLRAKRMLAAQKARKPR